MTRIAMGERIARAAFAPVDVAPLVLFRVAFGAILLVEVFRFFLSGWIERYYVEPHFFFKYMGFAWVEPLPPAGMYALFAGLGVLAVLILLGAFYRAAAALFFLGFTYVFLIDRANYLNHFYLICLVSFALIWIPANRALSIDAALRPSLRADDAPAWTVWLLRLEIGIPYVFGGLAKLNADWMLRAQPMRLWLAERTDFPLIGRFFDEPWMAYAMSWGGALLDLAVVPLLLCRPTRRLGLVLAVAFHLMNHMLFRIGIFPWFMLAALIVFLPPGSLRPARWRRAAPLEPEPEPEPEPGRGAPRLDARRRLRACESISRGASLGLTADAGVVGGPANFPSCRTSSSLPSAAIPSRCTREPIDSQALTLALLALAAAVQLVVPLRHFAYPGDASFTEEGHEFAWHMMLRSKTARVTFHVTDADAGTTVEVRPRDCLTSRQARRAGGKPELIRQLAHHLADEARARGARRVEVRVHALV